MKVTPRRSFFAGFDGDGKRVNYQFGKTYDLPEKTVQAHAQDFITLKEEVERVEKADKDKEKADSKAEKGKETAEGKGAK